MDRPNHPRDEVLVRRARQGDPAALGALIERYLRSVHGLAFALTGSPVESDDVAQEAFLRAFRRLAELENEEKLSSWLSGIVRRVAWERHRDHARQEVLVERLATRGQTAGREDDMDREQAAAVVRSVVSELPEDLRAPTILFYLEGRSTQVVAERLGLKPAAVRKRLQRARERLKESARSRLESALGGIVPAAGLGDRILEASLQSAANAVSGAATARAAGEGASLTGGVAKTSVFALPAALAVKVLLPAVVLLGVGAALWLSTANGAEGERGESATDGASVVTLAGSEAEARPGGLSALRETARPRSRSSSTSSGDDEGGATTSSSGSIDVRLIRSDTGDPAKDIAVELLRRNDGEPPWVSVGIERSDASGRCGFAELSPGLYAVRSTNQPPIVYFSKRIELKDGEQEELALTVEPGSIVTCRVVEKGTFDPVPGILIFLNYPQRFGQSIGLTDGDGRVTSNRPMPVGSATIALWEGETSLRISSLTAFGSHELEIGSREITADSTELTLEYPWSGELVGRVLSPGGSPIAGADVRAVSSRGAVDWSGEGRAGSTDSEGRFRLRRLPTEHALVVAVRAEDWAVAFSETARASDPHDGTEILVTLRPEARLRGRVRNANGQPVVGATVSLDSIDVGLAPEPVEADADGVFRLDGAAAGRHFVIASWPDEPRHRIHQYVELKESELTEVELVFDPATEIRGRVVPAEAASLQSVGVRIESVEPGPTGEPYELGTGVGWSEGQFVFTGLAPGQRYRILARRGSVTGPAVEVTAGATDVEVPWSGELATVHWTIVDDSTGEPIDLGLISSGASGQGFRSGRASQHYGPGRYETTFFARGHAPVDHVLLIEPGDTEARQIEIRLPAGRRVEGRVVDVQGRPVQHARVSLAFWRDLENSQAWVSPAVLEVLTDADGAFVFDSLPQEGGTLHASLDDLRGEAEATGSFVEIVVR